MGTLELIKRHFLYKTSISRKDSRQAHFQVKIITGVIGSDSPLKADAVQLRN